MHRQTAAGSYSNTMYKLLFGGAFALILFILCGFAVVAHAQPVFSSQRSLIPFTDNLYYLGSTSPDKAWKGIYTYELCLNGSCRTSWPSGGAGGSISTSTDLVDGLVVFSTGVDTIGNDTGFAYSSSLDRLTVQFASTTALSSGYASSTLLQAGTLRISGIADGCLNITSGVVGGTGIACGAGSSDFPFTPTAYGNATSTTLGFLQGFLAIGSSTITGNATTSGMHAFGSVRIPTLTSELLEVDANGVVGEATAGSDYEVPVTAGDGLTRTVNDFDCDTATGAVFGCLPAANFAAFDVNRLATSTALTAGQVIYSTSGAAGNRTAGVATTTVSCAGNVTCTSFVAIGASPITLTGVGGSAKWATSTLFARAIVPAGGTFVSVGSTTPYAKLSLHATSTDNVRHLFAIGSSTATATTTLFNIDNVGNLSAYGTNAHFGSTTCGTGGLLISPNLQGIEYCGNDNSDGGGVQIINDNNSAGANAWGGFTLNNNLADATLTHFGGIYLNSSNYTSTFFGTALGNKNQMIIQNTDGQLSFFASTNTEALNPAGITFFTGGTDVANERFRIGLNGNVGISSSTPFAKLSIHARDGETNRALFSIASSTASATSTFFSISNTGALSFAGVTGTAWSDFCTSITGGAGLCDGTDATGAGGAGALATSTNETRGRLAYWTSTNGTPATLGDVATTTLAFSGPFTGASALGALVGGSNSTVLWTGLSTTSQPASSNLLVSNGLAGVYGVATSAPTVTAPITYSGTLGAFVGGVGGAFGCTTASATAAGCISVASFNAFNTNRLSTSSALTQGQVLYATGGAAGQTVASVATSSIGATGLLAFSGSAGAQVGGTAGTYNLAAAAANTVLVNGTGDSAIPTFQATSTFGTNLYGQGTSGQVLMWSNGAPMWAATSTCVALTGSADLCDGNDASGGAGGGELSPFSTSTPYLGAELIYPDVAASDFVLGRNSTTTAPFWWDVSATSTYIGQYGEDDGRITFAPTGRATSTLGIDASTGVFAFSMSDVLGSLDFFNMHATSSVLTDTSTLGSLIADTAVRVGIGLANYLGFGGLLDHFVVTGRVNTQGWLQAWCDSPVGGNGLNGDAATDGTMACGPFNFFEDGTDTLTAVAGNGYTYGRLTTFVVNDGSGVFLSGPSAGFLTAPTSTPVLEATARIGDAQNASTTNYFIGFSNLATAGTAFESPPTVGCFFTASSTQANWRAVCRTALATGTYQDTGISSSTVFTGNGSFRRFRIEMDATKAYFYIQEPNGNLQKTNEITHNLTTQVLNAGVHYGQTTLTPTAKFDFFRLRVWWRDFVPAT